MFATLLGALPRPPEAAGSADDGLNDGPGDGPGGPGDRPRGGGARIDAAVIAAIQAQETASLEPITDGRLRDPAFEQIGSRLIARVGAAAADRAREGDRARAGNRARAGDRAREADLERTLEATVGAWRFAAAQTSRAVKQALPGPYSIGRRAAREGLDASVVTLGVATALRDEIEALALAGCPLIEIEETEAHTIGADAAESELFREAHRRLTAGMARPHLTLSIVGGSAWKAGLATILAGSYASFAFDLIAGSDNWNLVTRLPGDRGVIAGALPAKDSPADAKELLLWAARYAAGSSGRGLDRVGLGSAGSWANLTWEAAVTKMDRLGEAARLASMPAGAGLARELDPRAVSARTAAMGHGSGLAPDANRPRRGRG